MPSIAATVRRDKDTNPDRFCPARGCLWRVKDRDGVYIGPCGKHGTPSAPDPDWAATRAMVADMERDGLL